MIFVAVGTQLPFPRLIRAVDEWAGAQREPVEIFAQIGPTTDRPRNFKAATLISPSLFDHYIASASLVVAHAGVGTIVSALLKRKPVIVMPRLAQYREQRNDHQTATVRRLVEQDLVHAVSDCNELKLALTEHTRSSRQARPIPEFASDQLLTTIRRFLEPARLRATPSPDYAAVGASEPLQ